MPCPPGCPGSGPRPRGERDVDKLFQPKRIPIPKLPLADHLVCMECGAHIEHGFMIKHYTSVHPENMSDQEIRRLAHDLHVREQALMMREAAANDPAFLLLNEDRDGPAEITD